MKAQLFTAVIAITAMAASQAFAHQDPADVNLTKAALNVDWNKTIEGNNIAKKDIQKSIDQSLAEVDAEDVSEKSRVLDFVDLEVGWDAAPFGNEQIVDRRPNSLEEPQPVDLKLLPAAAPGNI